jgi:hypothetical protein
VLAVAKSLAISFKGIPALIALATEIGLLESNPLSAMNLPFSLLRK